MGDAASLLVVEMPSGMYGARLDDRGRIKLPTDFQKYFEALGEKKLFVTSVDRRIARIFPMEEWRKYLKSLDTYPGDPNITRRIRFNADVFGSEAEMDSQGRILFSPELRRKLEIENQPVKIHKVQGWAEVLSEKIFEEMDTDAAQLSSADIDSVEKPRPN
jgi:MraZ protein